MLAGIISVGRGKRALAEWFPNPGRFSKKKPGDKGDDGNGGEAPGEPEAPTADDEP
jgi:hypothetical protein